MSKIKNVLFTLDLEGRGVVNMDSNDQKWMLKKTHLSNFKDNSSFAKKSFKEKQPIDENDASVSFKLKISHDCMGKSMYGEDIIAQNPNIVHSPALLYSFLSTPAAILRGYLLPRNEETLKMSGAVLLTDAIQTCDAKSSLEFFSRSGEKSRNDGTTDIKDTTIFTRESVGDIKYSAKGNIDLMKLQFMPCDSMFDRYAFNPDYFEIFKEFLQKRVPNFNSELGYYQLTNSGIQIPEYGFLFSNENIVFLVKEALKRLVNINIKRNKSYAKVETLKIKLVSDPIVDTYNNPNNWITIGSYADIDALNFDAQFYYDLVNLDDAKAFREDFEEKIKVAKQKHKEAREAKAKEKGEKSGKKASDKSKGDTETNEDNE